MFVAILSRTLRVRLLLSIFSTALCNLALLNEQPIYRYPAFVVLCGPCFESEAMHEDLESLTRGLLGRSAHMPGMASEGAFHRLAPGFPPFRDFVWSDIFLRSAFRNCALHLLSLAARKECVVSLLASPFRHGNGATLHLRLECIASNSEDIGCNSFAGAPDIHRIVALWLQLCFIG
jgi:hypothetical protein